MFGSTVTFIIDGASSSPSQSFSCSRGSALCPPKLVVLHQRLYPPLLLSPLKGNSWQCLGTFLVATTWEQRGCYYWHLVGRCNETFNRVQRSPVIGADSVTRNVKIDQRKFQSTHPKLASQHEKEMYFQVSFWKRQGRTSLKEKRVRKH